MYRNLHLPQPLLRCAVTTHTQPSEWIRLRQVWNELSAGAQRVVDSFFSDERGYLILTTRITAELHPGRDRLAILQDVLCANAQKVVAYERDMAPSTVASNAKACLMFIGLNCNPSRVPPLVQQAALASRFAQFDQQVPLYRVEHDGVEYQVVSAPRAEGCLRAVLSDAEFKVVRALIEGHSHVEIAKERGTSRRTIANQLATAFRRIGVSSRGELLHQLSGWAAHGLNQPA